MRDDKNRVTVALWNMIKPYMNMEADGDMTPTFGDIVDRFRILYNIYISVTPSTNDNIIINRYRYDIFKLFGNDIKEQWTSTENSYTIAMRKAIEKAIEFIDKP